MIKLQKKIVKLNGGLGNQMFQYAFALVLAKMFNADIFFDFSFFDEIIDSEIATKREFELGVFNFNCPKASNEELSEVIVPPRRSKLQKFLWEYFQIKNFAPNGNAYIDTSAYCFKRELLKLNDYFYYNGYFQNENYFKHYRSDVINAFSLKGKIDEKNQSVLDVIKSVNSVSIHIRRGDYVNLESASKFHGTCSLDYYERAINYICRKVKNPHFFIFSDDIPWVIENLKLNYPYTVIDFNQGKGYLDMELMKNCKHNILANSSFSWWGAWLNENPNKIVIAPKKWIEQKGVKCNIVPNCWIKL